jgi:DNA repair protein RecN (Recombination protein N)
MLAELRVRRLALIDEADVAFDGGLNVVSGETGEGKSLLLSAILLLIGDRADRSVVRSGSAEAEIEGRFTPPAATLQALRAETDLIDASETEICLRRVVQADGRSRAYLNGAMCPIGLLKRLGERLVDLHGSRDQQELLRREEQEAALDRFAGVEALVAEVGEAYARRADLLARAEAARVAAKANAARAAELDDAIADLSAAELNRGELEALLDERRLLGRAAEIERLLDEAATTLHEGGDSVSERAGKLRRRLEPFASLDARASEIVERLEAMSGEAADLSRDCERLRDSLESGAARARTIEERLEAIHDLERRYGARGDLLIDALEAFATERAAVASAPSAAALLDEAARVETELHRKATELLTARKASGARLAEEVVASLKDLKLPHARFAVDPGAPKAPSRFDANAIGPRGYGAPRFLVSMNVGEDVKPLEDVASGGELARVLLSLKGALAEHHLVPTLVFDEIDAGVGARAGAAFGRRLATMARGRQILVVTHLAQTAAFAARHFAVRKTVALGRTLSSVAPLDRAARVRELAAMLGGDALSEHAVAQAKELLAEAGT